MSFQDIVELSSDDEEGESNARVVKQEPGLEGSTSQPKELIKNESGNHRTGQARVSNGVPNAVNATDSSSAYLDRGTCTIREPSFASSLPPAPLSRQFWKAGSYSDGRSSEAPIRSGQNTLRVHPKFLHSNATSHKWAFGAIAELLDNAFDEIQNGATFVKVDKISNPHDGNPALLIQDDGGGMDPESMRRCMSFGFSDKKSNLSIGQYGNGFKTSTMRLGADVIVFSRNNNGRTLTQSVGLLSYTFLRQTGHDRIVVPMVDYQFNESTRKFRPFFRHDEKHFLSNVSMLLKWSPFRTNAELKKQFDDIGHHGTKVIIYNLWFSDDGLVELDFESDAEDILLPGAPTAVSSKSKGAIYQQHIANRLNYSLRVYLSILYLRVPEHFRIILRGKVVEHHNIADDLKFPEFIMYKPAVGANTEAIAVTTIGFLKEAPHVNIHGFCVYHKNRLIMPFWRVVSQTSSRGRGVAGVLEANFVEPTHNKQDFEKTTLFQKLEARLKDMTLEYWDYRCGSIGYRQTKKSPAAPVSRLPKASSGKQSMRIPVGTEADSPGAFVGGAFQGRHALPLPPFSGDRPRESIPNHEPVSQLGSSKKRKDHDHQITRQEVAKKQSILVENADSIIPQIEKQPANGLCNNEEATILMQENKKLREECLEFEKSEEELNLMVEELRNELAEVQLEYQRLLAESKLLDETKIEKI